MDKDIKRQIDELNVVFHRMILESKHRELHNKFPALKDVNSTEVSIIRIVAENENVILKDIINSLNIPKSTLTSLIDRLEKKDILKRVISKRDRRSYGLELTETGKLIQKKHKEFEEDVYEKMIMALDTHEEREEFLRLLNKIIDNITKDE